MDPPQPTELARPRPQLPRMVLDPPSTPVDLVPRATASVDCISHPNLCEKPVSTNALIVPITLGILIPIIAALLILLFLHRRVSRRAHLEDVEDPSRGLDFGLGDSKAKTSPALEKDIQGRRNRQLSMDMDVNSPYLLPPQLNSSRESLHSLARSLSNKDDPYRPVTPFSDTASLNSLKRGQEDASIRTGASSRTGRSHSLVRQGGRAQEPYPPQIPDASTFNHLGGFSPLSLNFSSPTSLVPPPVVYSTPSQSPAAHAQNMWHSDDAATSLSTTKPVTAKSTAGASSFSLGQVSSNAASTVPVITPPPAVASIQHGPRSSSRQRPRWDSIPIPTASDIEALHTSHSPLISLSESRRSPPPNRVVDVIPKSAPIRSGTPEYNSPLSPSNHPTGALQPQVPSRGGDLAVPTMDNRRVSVGFRPLPPNEIMESDDPAYRASRIRSFYKEYFDDGKAESVPPLPPLAVQSVLQPKQDEQPEHPSGQLSPHQTQEHDHALPPRQYQLRGSADQSQPASHAPQADIHQPLPDSRPPQPDSYPPVVRHQPTQHQWRQYNQYNQYNQSKQYYDYQDDNQYQAQERVAYYDRESNAFVLPYAEPVTRRAMTPPLTRPHHMQPMQAKMVHGSIGGPQVSRGRPSQPEASASSRHPPRSSSSQSAVPGPGSGRRRQGSSPVPSSLPSSLPTLPNPSKLRNDSFALMEAANFAPPDNFSERSRGRSQSPSGERRPYQLNVPVHSPLVSSYDDMPRVPSPYLLSKSSSATGLEFAPPRRFQDGGDAMSDSGSVRSSSSNRNGLSHVNLRAIRDQTHLPANTIFSQAQSHQQLRPQWNMRP